MNFDYVKLEVLLPEETIVPLRNRLNDAGILRIGAYDHVISYTHTKGYWRPLEAADPFNGEKGEISYGEECKLEFRCLLQHVSKAKEIIKDIHPYEEVVIYVIPLLE